MSPSGEERVLAVGQAGVQVDRALEIQAVHPDVVDGQTPCPGHLPLHADAELLHDRRFRELAFGTATEPLPWLTQRRQRRRRRESQVRHAGDAHVVGELSACGRPDRGESVPP